MIALVAFGTLVLVPAMTAYRRPLQRVAALVLSLYVLAALSASACSSARWSIVEWPQLF